MDDRRERTATGDGPPLRPTLSVVIPMHQELENVEPMLERVHQGLAAYPGQWELICIDDGSLDGTGERLTQRARLYGPHVRIVRLRRNFGQTAAMQIGFELARGELIASLDGDLQNDPADIPWMIDELLRRDLDLLQGWRKRRADDLVMRRLPSWIANALIRRITGVALHDYGCSLKIYRAEIMKEVTLLGEMHRLIPVWVAAVTAPERIGEAEVTHHPRRFGSSKYGIMRAPRVLLDLLSAFFFLRFGARPGHFFGGIGILLGMIGTLLMAHLLWVKFGAGEHIGTRPMLFIAILLLVSAIQFVTSGILAEMLTRLPARSPAQHRDRIRWQSTPEQAGWKQPA